MSYDFSEFKIETFTGINDTPVVPTASKAGNGSHFIQQFNDLITVTEDGLNDADASIGIALDRITDLNTNVNTLNTTVNGLSSRWKVFTDDSVNSYDALPGDKILVFTTSTDFDINLPSDTQAGDSVSIINFNQSIKVNIKNYGYSFNGSSGISEVYINQSQTKKLVTLVYLADYVNSWVAIADSLVLTVVYPNS